MVSLKGNPLLPDTLSGADVVVTALSLPPRVEGVQEGEQ